MSDNDYFTDSGYLWERRLLTKDHQPNLVYAGGTILDTLSGKLTLMLLLFVDARRVFASRGR